MSSPLRSLAGLSVLWMVAACGSDSTTPAVLDLSRTVIAVPNGEVDVPTVVTIELRDEEGELFTGQVSIPTMVVAGENAESETTVTRNGDGSFAASYTPASLGLDTLRFTLDEAALPGGPMQSRVRIVWETGVGTPTIDGVLSAGEWDAAVAYSVFAGPLEGSTVRFLVDDANLYVSGRIPDPDIANVALTVRFDNEVDLVPNGDDAVTQTGTNTFTDGYLADSYAGDVEDHGDGAGAAAEGWSVLEISHPLDSGDSQDISVQRGGSLGICLNVSTALSNTAGVVSDPVGCVLLILGQPTYAELLISP